MRSVRTVLVAAAAAMAVVVVPLLLSGCSGGGSAKASGTAPGVWAAQVAQILRTEPSAFHSKVFADGKVTDAEYREAEDLFTKCMADQGIIVKFPPDPMQQGYTTHASPQHPDEKDAPAEDKCAPATIDGVQAVYQGMKANPKGLDNATGAKQCLKQHGDTEFAGMSSAQFARALGDESLRAASPQGALCLLDPFGQLGITTDQAWQMQASEKTVAVGG